MMTPSTPFRTFRPLEVAQQALPTFELAQTSRLLVEVAPRIARVVQAVLGSGHPDREDVQQQALLAFVQALPSFRGECEPRHFASRIAARAALLAARRTRSARARRDDGIDVDQLASGGGEAHDAALQRRRKELLRDLLATLPQPQAETLVLRVVLGWSLPEVASATGVPLNTVRSRVRLAKAALRAAIEEDPRMADELGAPGDGSAVARSERAPA